MCPLPLCGVGGALFQQLPAERQDLRLHLAALCLRGGAGISGHGRRGRCAACGSLDEQLANLDEGFSERLLKLIDRTGKKDSEIYKKANVDRKLFSKIRTNRDYRPSKATALAFAIALELDLDGTRDLIGRAGYALSRSSKFDVIIEYFIRQKNYDVFQINEVLFAFDQSLLGAACD